MAQLRIEEIVTEGIEEIDAEGIEEIEENASYLTDLQNTCFFTGLPESFWPSLEVTI